MPINSLSAGFISTVLTAGLICSGSIAILVSNSPRILSGTFFHCTTLSAGGLASGTASISGTPSLIFLAASLIAFVPSGVLAASLKAFNFAWSMSNPPSLNLLRFSLKVSTIFSGLYHWPVLGSSSQL
ncbi:hypothetical protein ES703_106269 [subsurface metagenome]